MSALLGGASLWAVTAGRVFSVMRESHPSGSHAETGASLHKSMTPCVTTKCSLVIVAKKYLRDTVIHSLYMQYYVGCISAID